MDKPDDPLFISNFQPSFAACSKKKKKNFTQPLEWSIIGLFGCALFQKAKAKAKAKKAKKDPLLNREKDAKKKIRPEKGPGTRAKSFARFSSLYEGIIKRKSSRERVKKDAVYIVLYHRSVY